MKRDIWAKTKWRKCFRDGSETFWCDWCTDTHTEYGLCRSSVQSLNKWQTNNVLKCFWQRVCVLVCLHRRIHSRYQSRPVSWNSPRVHVRQTVCVSCVCATTSIHHTYHQGFCMSGSFSVTSTHTHTVLEMLYRLPSIPLVHVQMPTCLPSFWFPSCGFQRMSPLFFVISSQVRFGQPCATESQQSAGCGTLRLIRPSLKF